MNRKLRAAGIAAVAALAVPVGSAVASGASFRTVAQPVEGQYIVVLKPHWARLAHEKHSALKVSEVGRQMSAQHSATLVRTYERLLRGFAVRANDAALVRLLADPRVDYVQEDGVMRPAYSWPVAADVQHGAPWGLDRIDQRPRMLNGRYEYTSGAQGVHAYVIDSGIASTHPEFAGRVGNGASFVADGYGTSDCMGHGTHVAGIIGGSTYGVAKGVTLHPVRVFSCTGYATSSQVIAGMEWVAANHVKPAVANLSLGGSADPAIDAAVANLTAAGVTVVAAAGNSNADACLFSPARAPSAISVGSSRMDDGRSYFSNFGPCVDLYAPGSDITSAFIGGGASAAVSSGTSMAAPHVAGAAALYLSSMPWAPPEQVASGLRHSSTWAVLGAGTTAAPLVSTWRDADNTPYPASGSAPFVYAFQCYPGGGEYTCQVEYGSATHAVVIWAHTDAGSTSVSGSCAPGQLVGPITVTVANRFGMVTRSQEFVCPNEVPM